MEAVTLSADSRADIGKGAARSLRREGKIPAVIYGHGRDPLALTVESKAVSRLLEIIGGETALIDVTIDGDQTIKAIVREVQRNPIRRTDVIHLDLYAVVLGEPIVVEVPIHITGTAEGVRNQGGVLDHHMHRVSIKVLPSNIPEHIEVDVTDLAVGQAIHISDLTVVDGELQQDGDVSIVGVLAARVEVVDTPEEDEDAEDQEPEVITKGKADEAEAEPAGE